MMSLFQLVLKVLQDAVQWRADDGQPQIAQRGLPGIGLADRAFGGGHAPPGGEHENLQSPS
jgi:hypothetical protein